MNNMQHIVGDNTRATMHMAVELCESGDFDDVGEAFRWLIQEREGGQEPAAWIPVDQALPEDDEMVLVSCETKKGVKTVNRAYHSRNFWHGNGSMSGVRAWMPLPDPYEGGAE